MPAPPGMSARPVVGRVFGCTVAVLSLGLMLALAPAAGARSVRVGPLQLITGARALPSRCTPPGTPYPDSEGEPSLAVDRRNPDRLVAAWIQDGVSPTGFSNLTASSRDGGRHWRAELPPGVWPCAGGSFFGGGDPWLSIGAEGTTYLASLAGGYFTPGGNAIAVHRSRDYGRSWSRPTYVDRAQPRAFLEDKPSVATNRYRPAAAYLVWTKDRQAATFAETDLYFARTNNRGRRWSRPARIYKAPTRWSVRGAEVIATGPRRLVCVFSRSEIDADGQPVEGGRIGFYALRSSDGGRSWSRPARIALTRRHLLLDPERGTSIRPVGTIVSADGGPHGRVYVAWVDIRSNFSTRILLSSSRGGRRWSRPRLVSRGAKRAFMADLAVTAGGTVGVRFYDLRRDRLGDAALTTDSWFRHSHDSGRHWSEVRLGRSFDLRTAPDLPGLFLGDYQGLVALPGGFATLFARAQPAARRGPTDLFYTRIKLRR